jgi:hypothetical protein
MNNAAPLAGFFAIRFLVITYLSPVFVAFLCRALKYFILS